MIVITNRFFIHKAVEDGTFSFAELNECCELTEAEQAQQELTERLAEIKIGIGWPEAREILAIGAKTGNRDLLDDAVDKLNTVKLEKRKLTKKANEEWRKHQKALAKTVERPAADAEPLGRLTEVDDDAVYAELWKAERAGVKLSWGDQYYLRKAQIKEKRDKDPNRRELYDAVQWLNTRHSMVTSGGSTRILFERKNPYGGFDVDHMSQGSFNTKYADINVIILIKTKEGMKAIEKAVANYWLKEPVKRHYDSVVFKPAPVDAPDTSAHNEFNTWSGFSTKPQIGDWSRMQHHIHNNICQRNNEHYEWLMAWLAHMFQNPAEKPGTAVILNSPEKGTGKSKLADWLRKMIGKQHSFLASSPKHLTGDFNAWQERCVFCQAEEAVWGGFKKDDSVLKNLVTSDTVAVERKGIDAFNVDNYTRIMMTTNEKHAARATRGERRYFVLRVGTEHVQDSDYFAAIDEQMENGGAEAMLFDLMKIDYKTVNLRKPPQTDALGEQIAEGLEGVEGWMYDVVASGELVVSESGDKGVHYRRRLKSDDVVLVTKEDAYDSYIQWIKRHRRHPQSYNVFARELSQLFGVIAKRLRGGRHFEFPSLTQLIALFDEKYGIKIELPQDAGENDETRADCEADRKRAWTENGLSPSTHRILVEAQKEKRLQ